MVNITFSDPLDQSEYDTPKGEIKKKKGTSLSSLCRLLRNLLTLQKMRALDMNKNSVWPLMNLGENIKNLKFMVLLEYIYILQKDFSS